MQVYSEYTEGKIHKTNEGRLVIYLKKKGTKGKIVSYPKYLIEKHLNKYLARNETVHHINGNFLDNRIENLKIIDRSKHASNHAKRLVKQEFICPYCGTKFKLSGEQLHDTDHNRKKGKAGPFCSRSCAGKYGAFVQNGGKKLEVKQIKKTYYTKLYGDVPELE